MYYFYPSQILELENQASADAISAEQKSAFIGAALYLIPLLFIHYPDSLKQQVTQELKERREKSGTSVS